MRDPKEDDFSFESTVTSVKAKRRVARNASSRFKGLQKVKIKRSLCFFRVTSRRNSSCAREETFSNERQFSLTLSPIEIDWKVPCISVIDTRERTGRIKYNKVTSKSNVAYRKVDVPLNLSTWVSITRVCSTETCCTRSRLIFSRLKLKTISTLLTNAFFLANENAKIMPRNYAYRHSAKLWRPFTTYRNQNCYQLCIQSYSENSENFFSILKPNGTLINARYGVFAQILRFYKNSCTRNFFDTFLNFNDVHLQPFGSKKVNNRIYQFVRKTLLTVLRANRAS